MAGNMTLSEKLDENEAQKLREFENNAGKTTSKPPAEKTVEKTKGIQSKQNKCIEDI